MKVAVLLFSIDDLVDGTLAEPRDDEADALLTLCNELALTSGKANIEAAESALRAPLSQPLADHWRETARCFSEFCSDLACTGPTVYPFFCRMFVAAMEGMRTELRARRTYVEQRDVQSFDDYLVAGQASIASPVVYATLLVSISETSAECPSEAVDAFAMAGGACLRLANDVRSYQREIEFEQRPNSVVVLMYEEHIDERESEARVVQRAEQELQRMISLRGQLPDCLQAWATSVICFTRIMFGWYMLRELHQPLSS